MGGGWRGKWARARWNMYIHRWREGTYIDGGRGKKERGWVQGSPSVPDRTRHGSTPNFGIRREPQTAHAGHPSGRQRVVGNAFENPGDFRRRPFRRTREGIFPFGQHRPRVSGCREVSGLLPGPFERSRTLAGRLGDRGPRDRLPILVHVQLVARH